MGYKASSDSDSDSGATEHKNTLLHYAVVTGSMCGYRRLNASLARD
jgi:hypothetical protein